MLYTSVFLLFVSLGMVVWCIHTSKPKHTPASVANSVFGKYKVVRAAPQGPVAFWQIAPSQGKELPYAWAMVEYDPETMVAFLWMIFVREEIRNQGYGTDMMRCLQETFREIRTHYYPEIISRPGIKLCLKCGFDIQPPMFKRDVGVLTWKRS